MPAQAAPPFSGINGMVYDILTEKPIVGALISAPGGPSVASDSTGYYRLPVQRGEPPVSAGKTGFIGMTRQARHLAEGSYTRLDFAMLPEDPDAMDYDALYTRLMTSPESPLSLPSAETSRVREGTSFSVPNTIWVSLPDGTVTQMPLDEYLRHVVPAEMPASWPREALRAQAVAARTYAVAWGATQSNPICTTTRCQYYSEATQQTTDDAVWSTSGVVAADAAGRPIGAFYFAKCNGQTTRNSEEALANTGFGQTCTVRGWSATSYCRARPCTNHAPYGNSCGYFGHGVGMCQKGASDLAIRGLSYVQILHSFYTGIQLLGVASPPLLLAPVDGYLVRSGTAIALSWQGTGTTYQAKIVNSAGQPVWTGSQTASTSVVVPAGLSAGQYFWQVMATAGEATANSAQRRLIVADAIFGQGLPSVAKGAGP